MYMHVLSQRNQETFPRRAREVTGEVGTDFKRHSNGIATTLVASISCYEWVDMELLSPGSRFHHLKSHTNCQAFLRLKSKRTGQRRQAARTKTGCEAGVAALVLYIPTYVCIGLQHDLEPKLFSLMVRNIRNICLWNISIYTHLLPYPSTLDPA